MSEFIAEARVSVLPDVSKFRAELQAELTAATASIKPVTVPVVPIASTGAQLVAQNRVLSASAIEAAGAQAQLGRAAKESTASLLGAGTASGRLDAALLGLRTAAGSTAVIGLGAAALAAIVAGKAFRGMVSQTAALEQNLDVFQVTAGATASEMERVSAAARQLGQDTTLPAVTAADAAQAMTDLAKAGLDVQDSLSGARGVLQLAAAAQIDISQATELTANALNTFSLNGAEAVHVADLLTGASQAAQGDITDMGIALQQAGAAAKLAGISLDDTIALIALLAKNGLAGSDAGTSLRVALLRLASPTAAARKILHQLNIDLVDLNGNLRPEVFAEFFQATSRLSRLEQLDLAVKVFGQDAVRAFGLIGSEGVAGLENMRAATSEAGIAAEVAGARTRGFSGEVGALQSNLQTLGSTLGTIVIPTMESFVGGLNRVFKGVGLAIDQINALTTNTDTIPQSLDGVSRAIAETQAQIDSFARTGTVPPALTERLAELNQKFAELSGATHDANLSMATTIERFNAAAAAADKLKSSVAGAADVLSRDIAVAQAQGNQGRELSLLRQREARQQSFLERILARPQTQRNAELATKAANNLRDTRKQIQAILDSQTADAKAAARDAQSARDKRDQAILDIFGGREAAAQNALIRAQGTKTLNDDLAAQVSLLKILTAELEAIKRTVKNAKTRAQEIARVTREMIQVGQDIQRSRQAQREAIRAAAQERQQRAEESIQLDVSLAQTTGNTRAEIAARERLIALLKKEQSTLKKGTLEYKRLRNEIAEQNAAIKNLKKEKDKQKNNLRELTFAFLQTQAGFAANLLGNIIPGGATAGLVGGTSTTGGFGQPGGPQPGGGVIPGMDVSGGAAAAAAVSASRERGVRPVQVDTTNQLLRHILRVLQQQTGRMGHPEARYQKATGSAIMDTEHGIG